MKARWRGSSLAGLLAALWLALCAGAPLPLAGAPTEGSPASSLQTVTLEYQETEAGFLFVPVPANEQPERFRSEPDFKGRPVLRGHLQIYRGASNLLAFAWDYQQGKLHLDLNRNGNLTDDPAGIVTCTQPGFGQQFQSFTNVHLTFATTSGVQRCAMNLDFNRYNRLYVYGRLRSFWQGKISLEGRDWQLGLIENPNADPDRPEGKYLLLRPWEARQEPFNLQDGSLAGFPFRPHLFFNSRAYELLPDVQNNSVKLVFKERQPQLGELKLSGAMIDRLVLRGTNDTVVLDRPGAVVKVPVGDYGETLVQLKQGALTAVCKPKGGARQILAITPQKPAALTVGGPLTNTVEIHRQGRTLNFQYQLTGAGGAEYSLLNADQTKPPRFAVHQAGKEIHSGKFEFG